MRIASCRRNATLLLALLASAAGLPACAAEKETPKVGVDEKAGAVTIECRVAKPGEAAATRLALIGPDGKESDPRFVAGATVAEITDAIAKLKLEPGTAVRIVIQRAAPAVRRVHAFISGGVQGVGFRDFTQRSARAVRVTGWVRNLADGRVEAVIEGPNDAVDALVEKIKKGPSTAHVTKFESSDEEPKGEFKDFDVLR